MRKNNTFSFGSKEEYFISDIYSQRELIAQGIRSKLILSDIKYSNPTLFLYPLKDEYENIVKYFELEIKGCFEYLGGEKAGEIHIPKGYMIKAPHTLLASSWEECIVEVIPEEIYKKDYINIQEEIRETKVIFSITDNRMVRPWDSIVKSFTGEVKIKLDPTVILDLEDGWNARFENQYRYLDKKIEEVEGTFTSSRLVLTLEKNEYRLETVNEVKKLENLVETLLWYLSLASRQRTTWIEWAAEIGTELVEYYRHISFPQEISDNKESLVSEISIQEFLRACIEYEKQKNKIDLYLPIIYLVGAKENSKTIEMEFLSLFIALESLLNVYGMNRHKNKHFTNEADWQAFYEHMKKAIDEIPELKDKDSLIRKVGIFNQVSTKVLYDDFCKEMRVDNSDLWPIYGNNRHCLYLCDIRNKLIHGKRFEVWPLLSKAKDHLRWIVERCLLAVLDWREKTEVFHAESLQKYTAYRDWGNYYENKNHYK